jgi:hypothetical protein
MNLKHSTYFRFLWRTQLVYVLLNQGRTVDFVEIKPLFLENEIVTKRAHQVALSSLPGTNVI